MSKRAELIAWWRETPKERRKYARLSARGAVACELNFRAGDLLKVQAEFRGQAQRLASKHPAFWREVQALLAQLEAEAEVETVEQVASELEQAEG